MTRWLVLASFAMSMLAQSGCSLTTMAANQTVKMMVKGSAAFDKEHDVWLARASATGNLKFLEGVLEATPDNEELLVLIARSYTMYSFAFLEWDLVKLDWGTDEYDAAKARAFDFYHRARKYAVLRMSLDFDDFPRAVRESGERLSQILEEADEDHVGALYWLAFSWGSMINLNNEDPDLLADLPRVKQIMAWVVAKAPAYENAGPHMFFGTIETALPKALGGKPQEAKKSFDKAIELTGGKFLLAKALYARFYMTAVNDRAGYERLLKEVLDAREDIMPEQRMANEIAKLRAKHWLGEIDEQFD